MLNEDAIKFNHEVCLKLLDKFVEITKKNEIKYYLAFGSCLGAVRHKGFIPWDVNIDILMTLDEFNKLDKAMQNEDLGSMSWCCPKDSCRIFPLLTHKDAWNHETRPNLDISVYINVPNNYVIRTLLRNLAFFNIKMFKLKNTNVNRVFPFNVLKLITMLIPNAFYNWFVHKLAKIGSLEKFKNSTHKMILLPSIFENREELKSEWFGNYPFLTDFENRKLPILNGYHEYLRMRYGDYMTPQKWEYKEKFRYAK